MKDFFISYNQADRQWAEWIASELERAGHSTIIQAWDFRPGSNFVLEMDEAAKAAKQTIAVLSPSYLDSRFTQPEWAAAFAKDPTGQDRRLLPIRVRECDLDGLLAQIVYLDLVEVPEVEARERLLAEAGGGQVDRTAPRPFPGTAVAVSTGPEALRYPGVLPPIWNVPHHRNPNFTGRVDLLEEMGRELAKGGTTALVQAVHGLGGVGKTQLALEYVYRHIADYDLVWWIRAEEPATLAGDYAALAGRLGLSLAGEADQGAVVAAVRDALAHRAGWLLVFDNVGKPEDIRDFRPASGGQILVTSRNPNWRGSARPLLVEVMQPEEAVEFLLKRSGQEAREAAAELAKGLGYLPLALAQAAAYVDERGKTLSQYLILFRQRQRELLERGQPDDYPATVATTWDLAFREASKVPGAADLLSLCAFLAPDDIPLALITGGRELLPEALATVVANEIALDDAIHSLRCFSLLEPQDGALSVHRLVQAVTRDRLSAEECQQWGMYAVELLCNTFPFDSDDFRTWRECSGLLPHALSAVMKQEDGHAPDGTAVALLDRLGRFLYSKAEHGEAEPLMRRALAIDEAILGPGHPDVGRHLNNLALLLQATDRASEAELLLRRALAIGEATFSPDHPEVGTALGNLALLLQATGRAVEAEPLMRRALAIDEACLGSDHPDVGTALNNLALLLQGTDRAGEAEPLMRRALAIAEAGLGADHPQVGVRLNNLALLLKATDRLGEAEPLMRRALAIDEASPIPDHPDVGTHLCNLALLLQATGRAGEAEPLMHRALGIFWNSMAATGHRHPHMQTVIGHYLGLLAEMGFSESEIRERVREGRGRRRSETG